MGENEPQALVLQDHKTKRSLIVQCLNVSLLSKKRGVYCQQYPKYSLTYINKKQYTINNIQTIKIMNT